jgi:Arc/MetJ family transcription regulator
MLVVSRTNIDIDDELIAGVMRIHRLPTKRAAVDYALRRLVAEPMTRDEALAMQGAGWHGDLETIYGADDVPEDLRAPDSPRRR